MQDEPAWPAPGLLPSDNSYLSRPKLSLHNTADCTDLSEAVASYVCDSLAENTRRAYQSDLRHFEVWGGSLPASPQSVAAYLAAYADRLSVTTLVRRLASLSKAHQSRGLGNPVRTELVRATLRGIKRQRRRTLLQAKPLLRDDLLLVLDAMGNGLKDLRDRALLLIGFAAALRRSELVALDVADVEHVRRGVVLHLKRSKTDQDGQGHNVAIPYGRGRWCPIDCLDPWWSASGIAENAIFRPVDRHARVSATRLSGEAVSILVRERIARAASTQWAIRGTHSAQGSLPALPRRAFQPGASRRKLATHPRPCWRTTSGRESCLPTMLLEFCCNRRARRWGGVPSS